MWSPSTHGVAMIELGPGPHILSALKPAERGDGIVVRVLNPSDAAATAALRVGFPLTCATAVRLDEEPAQHRIELDGQTVLVEPGSGLHIPAGLPHALSAAAAEGSLCVLVEEKEQR